MNYFNSTSDMVEKSMLKVFVPFRGADLNMKNQRCGSVLRLGLVLFCTWAAARGQLDLLPELSLDDVESGEESAAETAAPVAQENETKEEAHVIPDTRAALPDVASAREKAIGYLRSLAAAENADGLFYPPDRRRTVVGWTVKDVRYAEKMGDVPVYEAVEEFRTVNVGDEYNPVMVRKMVLVQKVVGTRQEKRVVQDTNGPIVRQEKVPEYGPGGLDDWNSFQFGHNAMAITAMMRAGVDPADEGIRGVADTLFDILPIEACFFLSDPVDLGKAETQLGEWPVIAEFLLARQNDDGSWGEAKQVHMLPSSLRERMETLPVVHYYRTPSASELGRPHVYFNIEEEKQPVIRKDFLCPGRLLRTCYALLALSAEPGRSAESGEPAEDGGP